MSKPKEPRGGSKSPIPTFDPVIRRSRRDGWTADKQMAFIQALAECGCVSEACARVGISTTSAYALRARIDAQSFRYAWDAALDHAVQRLSDAAFSRAIHGVSRPVFFQGEQIGERRHHDERLTMFLLRYRDPNRYGKWNDGIVTEPEPDHAAIALARCLLRVLKDGQAFDGGDPPPAHPPYDPVRRVGYPDRLASELAAARPQAGTREQPGGGCKTDGVDVGAPEMGRAEMGAPEVARPEVDRAVPSTLATSDWREAR
jgi:hypothetical protein